MAPLITDPKKKNQWWSSEGKGVRKFNHFVNGEYQHLTFRVSPTRCKNTHPILMIQLSS